jgi:hypothetical protein
MYYDMLLTLTSDAISRLTQTIGNLDSLLRSNQHNIHQDQQSIKSLIISQFQHLNERFPSQAGPSSALAQMFPYKPAVSSATTMGDAARIFQCFIDQPITAGSNKGTIVTLARSHSSLSPHQINNTLENLKTIIQFAMAYILIALKELLIRLPQVLIIARMMQVLPRAISLMRQDCIRFEDALGRVQNLQYQQFQYWPIFEAMIKTQFEGVPGYGKILRRQYTLMCPGLHGQQLVAASWSQHVFPGITVFMAVDVKVPDFHDDRCPKCSRNNTSSHSATGLHCYSCGLIFSKGFATNTAESENSGARVEQLHPNGRLISGPSAEAGDNEATNPNDEFTDSEDATENLKVFKRVNLLRVPGDVFIADYTVFYIQGNGRDHGLVLYELAEVGPWIINMHIHICVDGANKTTTLARGLLDVHSGVSLISGKQVAALGLEHKVRLTNVDPIRVCTLGKGITSSITPKGSLPIRWHINGHEGRIYNEEFLVLPDTFHPHFDFHISAHFIVQHQFFLRNPAVLKL